MTLATQASSAEIYFVWNGHYKHIVVEGEIKKGDAQKLEKLIKTHPPDFAIAFNSLGGDLVEGLLIGSLIRDYGISTEIGTFNREVGLEPMATENTYMGLIEETNAVCASACAYAFLGGASRYMDADHKLGFHQFYVADGVLNQLGEADVNSVLSNAQEMMGALVYYLHSLSDIRYEILLEAIAAEPNEMNWLTVSEAEKYNAIQSNHYSEFYLEPYKKGIVAVSRIKDSDDGYATRLVDNIAQATVFCRNKNLILMLSSKAQSIINSKNTPTNVEAFWHIKHSDGDFTEGYTSAKVRFIGNSVYHDIDAEFLLSLNSIDEINVYLDYPRSAMDMSWNKTINDREMNYIKSLKNFCLK